MNLDKYIAYLKKWIKDNIKSANKKGVVLGISGGIDSAVCYALCKLAKINIKPIFIDINNSSLDKKCINGLSKKFGPVRTINASSIFDLIIKSLNITKNITKNNLKPRIRMTLLYSIAQENNLLVLGSINADELYTGYFTKFGDIACDICPLAVLVKQHIYEIARKINVPKLIIERKPSASLYENQFDENELNTTYKSIDKFLLFKNISNKDKKIIIKHHKNNLHKFNIVNQPKPYCKIRLNFGSNNVR